MAQHSARADSNAAASQDVLAYSRLHPTLDHPETAFFGAAYGQGLRPAA